jgi:hypothetical protein
MCELNLNFVRIQILKQKNSQIRICYLFYIEVDVKNSREIISSNLSNCASCDFLFKNLFETNSLKLELASIRLVS